MAGQTPSVAQLLHEIHTSVSALVAHREADQKSITCLEKTIYGNGQPGLVVRTVKLEQGLGLARFLSVAATSALLTVGVTLLISHWMGF